MAKTNYILFKPRNTQIQNITKELTFANNTISKVTKTDFLGVTLDENLAWDEHINTLSSKLSKNTYLIRCLKNCVPHWSIRNLYYSYVQSVIQYGILLWGPMAKKSSLKRIGIQQKKIIRIIGDAKYNASTSPIFKKFRILKLDDLIDLNLAKLAYNFSRHDLPLPILSLFNANTFSHRYFTRYALQPMIEKHRTTTYNKSFLCRSPALLHSLSKDIVNSESITSFTHKFSNFRFDQY